MEYHENLPGNAQQGQSRPYSKRQEVEFAKMPSQSSEDEFNMRCPRPDPAEEQISEEERRKAYPGAGSPAQLSGGFDAQRCWTIKKDRQEIHQEAREDYTETERRLKEKVAEMAPDERNCYETTANSITRSKHHELMLLAENSQKRDLVRLYNIHSLYVPTKVPRSRHDEARERIYNSVLRVGG
ncbi:MAG: hypothetical protein Q9183_003110 [Haloplaca sp. 2 TL-2023]